LALEIGRRKNASPTRGPKPITPMAQPQSRMMTGVRQGEDAEDAEDAEDGAASTKRTSRNPFYCRRDF
jgi:hypothetical protein